MGLYYLFFFFVLVTHKISELFKAGNRRIDELNNMKNYWSQGRRMEDLFHAVNSRKYMPIDLMSGDTQSCVGIWPVMRFFLFF